jgi:hypothetical protein
VLHLDTVGSDASFQFMYKLVAFPDTFTFSGASGRRSVSAVEVPHSAL